jgi:hypothetical protein
MSRKKGSRGGPGKADGSGRTPTATPNERAIVTGVASLGQLAERFGVSFAVFAAIVFSVWLCGGATTRDDFIREALFGQVTGRPILGIFLGILLINTVFPFTTWLRSKHAESKEIKRLTEERDRLQEKLIGRELHHTDGVGTPGTLLRVEQPRLEEGPPRARVAGRQDVAGGLEIEEPRQGRSVGLGLRSDDPGPRTGGAS